MLRRCTPVHLPRTPRYFAPISVILVINLLLSFHNILLYCVPSKLDNAIADAPTLDDCLLKSMSP